MIHLVEKLEGDLAVRLDSQLEDDARVFARASRGGQHAAVVANVVAQELALGPQPEAIQELDRRRLVDEHEGQLFVGARFHQAAEIGTRDRRTLFVAGRIARDRAVAAAVVRAGAFGLLVVDVIFVHRERHRLGFFLELWNIVTDLDLEGVVQHDAVAVEVRHLHHLAEVQRGDVAIDGVDQVEVLVRQA